MPTTTLTTTLRVDAAANAAAGISLAAAGGWLAAPVGLASGWPLRLVGLALVVYGIENLLVSRRISGPGLATLVAIDLLFAIAVVGLAVQDPTGAATWARWGMALVASVSAAFGIAKTAGLRSLADATDPRSAVG